MICRLENENERRNIRLTLFKDNVFVIAHKALKEHPCKMSVEEIFCTAESLVNHLLVNELTEADFIDYVVDDFEDDLQDRETVFQTLTIAFVKLCALRKVNAIASDVARALARRLNEYEVFQSLLQKMAEAEYKHIAEKGRIDLMKYELMTLSKEEACDEDINRLVNATLECSEGVIESVIVSFTNFNDSVNHKYDMQLHVLTQGYKDKQEGKEVKKIEYTFNNPIGTLVAQANRVIVKPENHE